VQTRAVELATEGHANLATLLTYLGGSLRSRFERTGNLQDIAEAIAVQTRAVDLTPEGHVDLPRHLANLGNSYARRYEDTGDLQDVVEAIRIHTQAVELTPEGHESQPGKFSNLGYAFLFRFRRKGDLDDAAEAIKAQARAVNFTPEGHADLPGRLTNLGNALRCRFERTGETQDIVEAIKVQTQAVDLTPEGHAGLPTLLHNLGYAWYHRYVSSGAPEHLEEAVHCHRSAATSCFGRPLTRVEAAKRWARLLNQYRPETEDVLPAFRTAIGLLPLVVGLEDTLQRRYAIIQDYKSLPLEASTVAFRLGRPDLALEWLEQGRCLVWGQQSQLHTPLDELRVKDGALAERLTDVAKQLEAAGASRQHSGSSTSPSEKVTLEDEAAAHVQLARIWDDLLVEVRAIPGFETFLQPLQCSAILQHLPASGAVVAINIHKDRCDAIALLAGSDKPLHVPLPDFTLEKAKQHHAALDKQLTEHHLRARDAEWSVEGDSGRALGRFALRKKADSPSVYLILGRLWNEVVEPILSALQFLVSACFARPVGAPLTR
jgi:tetratricopeptide (TPR) repeat protein